MNKQQLANKIWESANRMRSKIEANEYKDYILGFIFYKFLSDKEVAFLKKDGYEDADIQEHAHENNEQLVDYCQQHLGYFIAYDNLFSTWLAKGILIPLTLLKHGIFTPRCSAVFPTTKLTF